MKQVLVLLIFLSLSMPSAFAEMAIKLHGGLTVSPTVSPKMKLASKKNNKGSDTFLEVEDFKGTGAGYEYKVAVNLDWLEIAYLRSSYSAKSSNVVIEGEASSVSRNEGTIEFTTQALEATTHVLRDKMREGLQLTVGLGIGGVVIAYKDDVDDFEIQGSEWHLRGTAIYDLRDFFGIYVSYFNQTVTMVTGDSFSNNYISGGVIVSF